MKYCLSLSFGKDSLAMLLRILEEGYPLDCVLYVELGAEFDAVKALVERIRVLLLEKNIPFRVIRPDMSMTDMMLVYDITKRDGGHQEGLGWCGGPCRWGTAVKLQLLNRAYREHFGNEAVVEYVGISADESHRINRERNGNRIKIYPLVEWGMSEMDCLSFCHERGYYWNEVVDGKAYELYDLLDRVSCKYCVNKNLKELRNMYHKLPHVWSELKDLQQKIYMPFKKGLTVEDLEDRFRKEDSWMSIYDIQELFD